MEVIHKIWLIYLVAVSFLIGKSEGGPLLGLLATGACGGVCGAAFTACVSAGGAVAVALSTNPLTAPFATILAPWFVNGCGAGFGTCYATCVGGALIAPTT